jgi:hypothetical protein
MLINAHRGNYTRPDFCRQRIQLKVFSTGIHPFVLKGTGPCNALFLHCSKNIDYTAEL